MNPELSKFAVRLRGLIEQHHFLSGEQPLHQQFDPLALELFALQVQNNPSYQKICLARNLTPRNLEHWTQIPAVPTGAFKELELTSIPPAERTAVFHSSGTTEQKPSRHFHGAESLAVYEASLWKWFEQNCFVNSEFGIQNSELVILTPPSEQVSHSSLVHMFETLRQKFGAEKSAFAGTLAADGTWTLDFEAVIASLSPRTQTPDAKPAFIFGTAFSFVHLLDFLAEKNLFLTLPSGSRVLETGGYKNRSRSLPKNELHALITERLGVPRENIVCEYGMSELSSQAYEAGIQNSKSRIQNRTFQFPPWTKSQIVSPETGREVADGETGLIRIFDLANVFSVAAIQTEDLGVRRGEHFELLGRAQLVEPRGCSLMTA